MYSETDLRRAHGAGCTYDPAISLNIRDVISFYRRRWKAIGLVATVSVLLAAAIALSLVPLYTSTAQVIIEQPNASPIGEDLSLDAVSYDSSFVDSQVSVLRSTLLLRQVAESAALVDDPEFVGEEGQSLTERVRDFVFHPLVAQGLISSEPDEKGPPTEDLTARAAQRLRNALNIDREGRSYVIAISVTSQDPRKSAALANTVAETYISDQIESRYAQVRQASTWLTERMATLQAELKSAEDAVEDFRIKHNLLVTQSGTLTEQQLSELNIQLISARAELAEKRAALDQARTLLGTGGDLQSIPQVLASDVITGLRAQHSDVTGREADLLSRYGERHPQVINVRAERLDVERQIAAEVERISGNLANQVQMAESREASLALSLGQATGQTGIDNQVGIQLRELERIANANKTLYEGVLLRARLMEEETDFKSSAVRIISRASPAEYPSFPPKKVIMFLGLMMGAAVGSLGALAREYLHAGFATARQAEMTLELPILASLPRFPGPNILAPGDDRGVLPVVLRNPESSYREAVRTLRHALLMDADPAQTPVIQITSAIIGEGKSTLAISLAVSAADAGYRVLIIDGDLRRSGLTKHFGMMGDPGLVDLITEMFNVEQVIRLDENTGTYILPAGSRTMNPSDLLGSVRMRLFLEWARQSFDMIIVDSPPVGIMADAKIVSRYSDSVAFIVKWSSTPREAVSHALHRLNGAKIKGIAITMVDERKVASYGDHYYSQYAEPHRELESDTRHA